MGSKNSEPHSQHMRIILTVRFGLLRRWKSKSLYALLILTPLWADFWGAFVLLPIYIYHFFSSFFLHINFEEISEMVIFWPNLYFGRFCECRPKGHIIIRSWSGYSSPVATQPSGNIITPGIACGHCLECCNLCHFFSNWWKNFSIMCDEVVGCWWS